MARTDLSAFSCSIARTLGILDDTWSPLILRDAYLGLTRFDDLQRDLGVARNVLTERLERLVAHGLLERRPYQQRQPRYDYLLTGKGLDLMPALMALMAWGDRWTAQDEGPPALLVHRRCGEPTVPTVCCSSCGAPLAADEVAVRPGPGARRRPGTLVLAERAGLSPPPADEP